MIWSKKKQKKITNQSGGFLRPVFTYWLIWSFQPILPSSRVVYTCVFPAVCFQAVWFKAQFVLTAPRLFRRRDRIVRADCFASVSTPWDRKLLHSSAKVFIDAEGKCDQQCGMFVIKSGCVSSEKGLRLRNKNARNGENVGTSRRTCDLLIQESKFTEVDWDIRKLYVYGVVKGCFEDYSTRLRDEFLAATKGDKLSLVRRLNIHMRIVNTNW